MICTIEWNLFVEKERVRWQVVVRLGLFVFLEKGRSAFLSGREN
jgi:hypothetical protein